MNAAFSSPIDRALFAQPGSCEPGTLSNSQLIANL
jgi:hypothetical protein